MEYKDLVNCSAAPCALVSAEITEDSQRGAIRIACGNKAFCDIVGPGFCENMYCKDLAAADSNFEDLCVRSAVMGQRVHTYTHDEASGHWMDLTFFPWFPKTTGWATVCSLPTPATIRTQSAWRPFPWTPPPPR